MASSEQAVEMFGPGLFALDRRQPGSGNPPRLKCHSAYGSGVSLHRTFLEAGLTGSNSTSVRLAARKSLDSFEMNPNSRLLPSDNAARQMDAVGVDHQREVLGYADGRGNLE